MAIGWGIIGTGNHPDNKMVPAIKLAKDAEAVAVYSREESKAEAFAGKHQIPNAYSSLEGMLGDPAVDAVLVASPNFLHAQHTRMAAEAGKQVLVEKPMALSVEEAMEMVGLCRERGVKLGVGLHLRHHPGHQKARQLVEDGTLGVLSMASSQWSVGFRGEVEARHLTARGEWWGIPDMIGGASMLMGTGVHALDLLQYLIGHPIVEVAAITDGQTPEQPLEHRAVVAVRFADGTIGTMCCGRLMPDTRNDAIVYGSHGRISLIDTVREPLGGRLEVVSESVDVSESYERDPIGQYKLEIEAFCQAVQTGGEFHASGEDGLRTVQVTLAIIDSARTGRAVKIAP